MPISYSLFKNSLKDLPLTNYITKKDSEIQTNAEKEQYKNTGFSPLSTKEWNSSIYCFNKSSIKSLISKDFFLNILSKGYFNMLAKKVKTFFKRRRDNKIRYSANKLFISKPELQHTNSDISVSQSAFNKKELSLSKQLRKLLTFIMFKKIAVGTQKVLIPNHKNRLVHLVKGNFFAFKKWNVVFFKEKTNLFNGSIIKNLKKKYFNFYDIPRNSLLINIFKSQKTLFTCTNNIHFTTSLFSTIKLYSEKLGLTSLLEKIYSKEVNTELTDSKSVHLNSDHISWAIALKLRDRKNKAVRILRKAVLQMVNIPDLHTLITFDDRTEPVNKNNIIDTIKQQVVSGVRFEAAGRLTRRLTAMRAVFKYRYAGSLKNIRSSFNNESSTMLRGHFKSNAQHTLINSKTRNGTFGLKGWISSHMLTFLLGWMDNIIYLLIQLPIFITSSNKSAKKASYVLKCLGVYIVALWTFPFFNLSDLVNLLINDVLPKFLELNAYFPKDDLSVLHIILLPMAIVMLGLNSLNKIPLYLR